jgi:hypothetical protein
MWVAALIKIALTELTVWNATPAEIKEEANSVRLKKLIKDLELEGHANLA